MTDRNVRSPEIDSFLHGLPQDVRDALQELRSMIAAAAPDAVEGIAYGVPAFRYRGRPFVSFGAGKTHCSFYVQSPSVMGAHSEQLRGLRTSKGTVHFTPEKPLPAELVSQLVKARIAETDATSAASRRR